MFYGRTARPAMTPREIGAMRTAVRDATQAPRKVTISYISASYWHSAGMEITTAGGPPAGRAAARSAPRAAEGHPR
ncbi:hypothetical protein Srubr_06680 [Streptomyces rubradiris]|uniref:Uncharacterized protein n=1 Tax=Streptomyces rubradiris TaxID=285531 RepID=A0ABQ3R4W8_STRRR|nr:hypothetical protein GCM10018792_25740 [Streptomyces rubradiris]GHI50822.1 hypothetical protein Srubr_06680 [Streptomyces rubradiris]